MPLPIVLASQSPRRKQLLEWANVPFTVVVQATEETYPTNTDINEVPVFIAEQKAVVIQKQVPTEAVIIAADTIVVANNNILGKPATYNEAFNMLQQLNNNKHAVITGVVIQTQTTTIKFSDTTTVYFNKLTDADLHYYIEQYKPFDKAGAYGIQEWIGVVGIKKIEGDFYNVMGLPVNKVVQVLQQLKAL